MFANKTIRIYTLPVDHNRIRMYNELCKTFQLLYPMEAAEFHKITQLSGKIHNMNASNSSHIIYERGFKFNTIGA